MNKSFIAKVGWRVLHESTNLWAQVLRGKYKIGDIHDRGWMVLKGTWSSTWRSIAAGVRDVICPGHGWVLGDGRNVSFWTDKWLMGQPLLESGVNVIPEVVAKVKACEFWIEGIGWDLQRITPFVTEDRRLEMAAVVINQASSVADRLSWGETADGIFTVSSAHRLLSHDRGYKPDMSQFFLRIWRVTAPERVRVFL